MANQSTAFHAMTPPVSPDPIIAARADFPALARWTYLDVAARCVLPRSTRAALDAHLDEYMASGGDKNRWFTLVEETRRRFASLINGAPDEVAFTKNVSEGLNMIATAFHWRRGDNVIVCPALEHPNNVYPWYNMRRYGLEVREVAPRDGHVPADGIIERMDAGTRVVSVATVSFAPGFRADVEAIGRACRERGVLLLVDAAQSAGILHTDVQRACIDALATSTQKGLLGLYGMGFLYCRREWAERLAPAHLARFGVDLGDADAHETSLGHDQYRLMPGARRFDCGNYNYPATAAVHASLDGLATIGTERIERHVLSLAHALAGGLIDLGLPVCGGAPGRHLAHIVTVGRPNNEQYGPADERIQGLHDHLASNGVKHSVRRGTLRFAFHLYNNRDDVERVLDLSRAFLRK